MAKIFAVLYAEVKILRQYILDNASDSDLAETIVVDTDSERYKHLLNTGVVGIPKGARQIQTPVRCSQGSHQKEIILRAIERLQRREGIGKNVLTFGFGLISDDPNAQISSMPNIEYRCPNHSISLLQYNIWKTLLSRIGDVLMTHLLENTSIFLEVAPTCYAQITGFPVYDLIPLSTTVIHKEPRGKKRKKSSSNQNRPAKKIKSNNESRETKKHEENKSIAKPFDYHRQIGRSIFFARAMREKLPSTFLVACDREHRVAGVLPDLIDLNGLLDKIVNNHKSCPYKSLLSHHCPVQTRHRIKKTSPNLAAPSFHRQHQIIVRTSFDVLWCKRRKSHKQFSTGSKLEDFVSYRQVFLFMRAVCFKVLPLDLFGSKHNQNVFLKNMSRFIGLGRFDKLCLGQVMEKMKTHDCPWLKEVPSNSVKLSLLSKLLLWLMEDFVGIILKSFFYVTGTTAYRNRIFYYRKRVWHCLRSHAITAFLKKGMLKLISDEQVKQMIDSGSVLGISGLRFLPKSKSLRPIVNMKSGGLLGKKQLVPVNKQLQNLLSVLAYFKGKNPNNIGHAKFSMDEIYQAWQPFVSKWNSSGCKPLYFVKVDISNCYDSIDQHKLYDIIEKIIEENEEEYVIRRYAVVVRASGKPQRQFRRKVCSLAEYKPDFQTFVRSVVQMEKLHDIVFVDQVVNQYETLKSLLQQLRNHLFNNILRIGQHHYRQCAGISQGSVLSTILCNLYYGHMEKQRLNMEADEILMRVVDDSLFVTPDREHAVQFLDYMLSGISEYNCQINAEKTLVNFEYEHETKSAVQKICDADFFPWCGMVFNTKTLSVSVDYSRYTDLVVKDTMTLDLTQQPGLSMKRKLLYAMRSKCHKMYLDSMLNGEDTVVSNCYKLFLLTAWKFHYYARHLPSHRSVEKNPSFFFDMIVDIARFFHGQATTERKNSMKFQFHITCKACEWICVKAFTIVLSRHTSMYPLLLKRLRKFSRKLNGVVEHGKLEVMTQQGILDRFDTIFT